MLGTNTTIIGWPVHEPTKETLVGTARCISYNMGPVRKAVRRCVQELPDMQELFARAHSVLLKPNLLSSTRPPDAHVNTNAAIVQAIAEILLTDFHCDVAIGDSCGSQGQGSTARAIENSRMDHVAREVGARIYNVDSQPRHIVPFEQATIFKDIALPTNLSDFDLVISVAKLKTHMLTCMTGAVKNMFGLVPGEAKKHAHVLAPRPSEFATLLSDLYAVVRPGAAFIDAVIGMEGAGPTNGSLRHVEMVAASCDPVALDAFCAQVMGLNPLTVPLLARCHERRLGVAAPGSITVRGEPADAFAPGNFQIPVTYADSLPARLVPTWLMRKAITTFALRHAAIDQQKCERCGDCARNCPSQAIRFDEQSRRYSVDRGKCISCWCCAEVCPADAITYRGSWLKQAVRKLSPHS